MRVGIFSLINDLHAHVVYDALARRSSVSPHFVATDALMQCGGMNWANSARGECFLAGHQGERVALADLDVIWWRRVNQPQKDIENVSEPIVRELINNEWKAALIGAVMDVFDGTWVNLPTNDAIAGNKLYQLTAAAKCGFRVPETLVSQNPGAVRTFCREQNGHIIAKKLVGTSLKPLVTLLLSEQQLTDDESIRACPTIYQERINGTRHLRVNCFGDRVHTVMITSDVLDWRRDLSVPFEQYQLPSHVTQMVIGLTRLLGLEMSVMDMMIEDNTDEFVWLELNTQGQFLFGEGLAGCDLTNPFCDFLLNVCDSKRRLIA